MPLKKLNLEELEKKMNRTMWSFFWLWLLLGSVAILWVWIPSYVIKRYQPENGIMTPGTYGDTFGTVNALFAGLALAGLAWSIYQTNKELRLQKQVVLLQIEEMKESKQIMQEQSDSQKKLNDAINSLTSATLKGILLDSLIAELNSVSAANAAHMTRKGGYDDALQNRIAELTQTIQSVAHRADG